MQRFYDSLNTEIRNYLRILSPELPWFLLDYMQTPEMQFLDGISVSCGTNQTKMYNDRYYYSVLTHSFAVALIAWHFTGDKVQTLAGLFHDIATPAFKHCIDFLNGDSERQESTEERTAEIIKSSSTIRKLLKEDSIDLYNVIDYHMYPILDNQMPMLCADRLEYTLSGGLNQVRVFELNDISDFYNDLAILINEYGKHELGFTHYDLCEDFIHRVSSLWPRWVEDEDRLCMQFIADIVKYLVKNGYITINDLYSHSEKDIIDIIYSPYTSPDIQRSFLDFQKATRDSIYKGDTPPVDGSYYVSVKGKKRYLNPLTLYGKEVCRISDISNVALKDITEFLKLKQHNYVGFNFKFKP